MRKEFFFLEHTGPWWPGPVIAAVAAAATPSSATTAERNGDAG